jgi:Rad3-related DNA helicase
MPTGKIDFRLHDKNGPLEPRRYSSGKTQIDLIEEILKAFQGNDIVFLKATVGSGKSAVGLRTVMEFGRGVVSVPTKVLSDQYAAAYEGDKYFLKEDGSKAKIGILKGRRNFRCLHQADRGKEVSCDSTALPCKRPVDWKRGEHRIDALQECAHWGFIFTKRTAESARCPRKIDYEGVKGRWTWCMKGECPYWKQFQAYISADAIVMNSAKWAAELCVGRLPKVPLTVVDEADYWLDSLTVKVTLTERTIARLHELVRRAVEMSTARENAELVEMMEELREAWSATMAGGGDPMKLVDLTVEVLEEVDETSGDLYWKLSSVLEHRKHSEYDMWEKGITYFVPDPKIVLKSILDKVGGKWLLMSATVQDREVLKEVFGVDPTFVEGETTFPGMLIPRRLGSEEVVNHRKWSDEKFRRKYWSVLDKIMQRAKLPGFVPIHAHAYLPPDVRDRVLKAGDVHEEDGFMFTTKMDRGADLKGIKSIIILKFPYPDKSDPLLRGMERRLGREAFQGYYRDISSREFVQQIGRVLRSDEDVAEFWSPDWMCHAQLGRLWRGKISGGAP